MLRPLFSADFTTSADRLVSGSVLVISERNVEEVKDFCRGFAGRRSPTTFHLSQSLGARFLSQDPPATLSRSDRGLGGDQPASSTATPPPRPCSSHRSGTTMRRCNRSRLHASSQTRARPP